MISLQRHRGPDDAGVWGDSHIALGNCRLAIIDLSAAGHQPMTNAQRNLWVVQNGEIYNFQELRHQLTAAGYRFQSNCDTEVLLHGYTQWGADMVRHLRGMFAIALWDVNRQLLLLARDRFGIKPLYYYLDDYADRRRLVFASEIKPILAMPGVALQPNERLIYDFLAHRLLEHTADTFFAHIRKVPPAHYLLMDRTGHTTLTRYWDFEVNPDSVSATPEADDRAARAFRVAFFESVRHHLVSDVPIGSCLSGGLDSSAIVCALGQLRQPSNSSDLRTFTSSFEDVRFDERAYAQLAASQVGAQTTYTFSQPQGFVAELTDLVRHQEEPFTSTSIYAQWCLMRDINRAGLKVVLDGQGGDEQLLGYGKFYLFYLQSLGRQGRIAQLAQEALGLGLTPEFWSSLNWRHGLRYLGRNSAGAGETDLVHPDLCRRYEGHVTSVSLNGSLAERVKRDVTQLSLPILLRYEDKNSMAFSVEARVPFVDHVLTEHVAALPFNQKLRSGWTKYVLRQALRGVLPERIRLRRSKWGFVTPEEVWMRGPLAATIRQTFSEARFLPAWSNVSRLREGFDQYCRGHNQYMHSVFFRHYILEVWAQQLL
jgi:asparagine synthase (glutamine-hydrolysing)